MLLRMKEVNRLRVLQGYMDGKIEIEEASRILKRRARSVYRMVKKEGNIIRFLIKFGSLTRQLNSKHPA